MQGIQNQLNPWTLETILMTGVNTPIFVLGNIMWTYIFSIISFIPYLFIGTSFFHATINSNPIALILAFTISAVIMMGLAMVSTGLRILTKSMDPVTQCHAGPLRRRSLPGGVPQHNTFSRRLDHILVPTSNLGLPPLQVSHANKP
jgi:hypothetical protein